ncbi:hypothetical protein N7454_002899 [Penicillium verhagenii]|nr:hypothetical protein N7454_002899 [Penicillium verhagenii]
MSDIDVSESQDPQLNSMAEVNESISNQFVKNLLPLYQGPTVQIRVKPGSHEYTVSKALLCAESPAFAAMFEGNFRESQEMAVTLEVMEGVVSMRSVEALIQWLYVQVIEFDIEDHTEHISAAIEFARLAEKYGINNCLEDKIAEYIRGVFIQASSSTQLGQGHTHYLRNEHIASATLLPHRHAVRRMIVKACVQDFFTTSYLNLIYQAECVPTFGTDLLQEVKLALNAIKCHKKYYIFKDPISGKESDVYPSHQGLDPDYWQD